MEKRLNAFLSDLVIEAHKLQSFHWYVKGPEFFEAHAKLEEYYDLVQELVDDVAEAMLTCGMKPASTCKDFLANTGIAEANDGFVTADRAFGEVLADFRSLLESAKALKEEAEGSGHVLLVIKAENYIEQFSKAVWMLGQLQAS